MRQGRAPRLTYLTKSCFGLLNVEDSAKFLTFEKDHTLKSYRFKFRVEDQGIEKSLRITAQVGQAFQVCLLSTTEDNSNIKNGVAYFGNNSVRDIRVERPSLYPRSAEYLSSHLPQTEPLPLEQSYRPSGHSRSLLTHAQQPRLPS